MKKIFSLLLAALFVSTQAYADKLTASTTLPTDGKPEHVYTMVNGNGAYVGPTTAPATDENGLFAFYAVDGVDGAYYIYSHSAKKWLGYTKAASYSSKKGFVTLSDSRVDGAYFKVDNYSDDNYQIQPYTTAGSAQAIYLNWYQGVSANGGTTLGLWTDNGAKDGGSRYTLTESVIVERTYTISVPEGVTLTIDGKEYANGSTITVEGSLDKNKTSVTAPEGKFAVVSVDDVNNTITVNVATLPVQADSETYVNAWVYPKQQEDVGVAKMDETDGVYTLSNNVLAASYMKVGNALYFAGSKAMDLVAGTEPFTVAFGSGDNVPASAMTLMDVKTETLAANASAIGGAEHFAGVQLVANYEYTYKETKIEIVWRAVLRDGSHYLRTEMELTGVDAVDMYNVIPMIYNVDTEAAGSAPKVVGNTRGAVLMSDKIFAGLETPTAYNTVGEASGEEDAWNLTETKTASLTASSWTQVAAEDVPKRVEEATGANYPNVYAYDMQNVALKEGQKVSIIVKYTSGSHRLNFGGAVLLDGNGAIAAVDYHSGYSGGQHSNNTFTFNAPYDGTFAVRVFVENKTESIDASSTMTVDIYTAKEGAVINTAIVGIQGLWSRNTTLAAGDTWKVASVVGLVAQDGTQSNANIRETQKRRSFLAYSERERAVPWRTFPHYNSWYELNINRNNAAPGSEHTNFTAEDILGVMRQWKEKYFDKYGEGIAAFVIDDGWDNYGPWTFHSGFPNEMRDMSTLAKEMNAGIGAWLGPVGGYGQSGNYRRQYWSGKGGMQLSNPAYYETYLAAANNLVCQQDGVEGFNPETDNYVFFKFDGISGQFSAVGPDAGDTGNENAEGIIRLEQYVRENMREDIFFNTTVGTWASPFWYQISDATWRQENDHDRIGNNSINRENWITYRDRLVYQNYVQNSPICPINTLMTHGFILSEDGPPASDSRDYNAVLRELRCAFVCGSGIVELYTNCNLMNTINNGKLWEDVAECVAWQKKNADVLPDAHWVGGSPWNGSKQEVYGWASWNGAKATLALRNGGNSALTYTFTLREALEIPANITGAIILTKSFKVQDALEGLTEGTAIDIDQQLTVTLPGSTVFAFDGVNADPAQVPFEVVNYSPKKAESISSVKLEFNFDVKAVEGAEAVIALYDEAKENVVAEAAYEVKGSTVTVTLANKVSTPGNYLLVIPEGVIVRNSDDKAYSGELALVVTAPEPIKVTSVTPSEDIYSLSTIEVEFNKEVEDAATGAEVLLNDANGEKVVAATYSVEGKVLTVTLASEVTTPGEYTLVIPEGVVKGVAVGDAFSGSVTVVVEEFDVYEPRYTGTKTRTDRAIKGFTLTGASGENSYTLTDDEQTQDYTNATAVALFKVEVGEELTISFNKAGSWIHQYVFIDFDGDGFTASIAEGSEWAPAGDLVAYSFYNNDSASDESGWNSKGTVITGNDRNTPAVPAFNAPETAGTYRMRVKQDWCNIDPAGDADGKFGDFKANGGQIIDVMLEVAVPTGILNVNSDSAVKGTYDVHGRKIEQITTPGLYIVNGKKVLVK
ncbi:MAG: Ig-like domain-containing protein [Bacteroidaceae bacterium]|nr:Ig-like domain-containing protein [Bacteroidaceae bacterium]